MDAKRIADAIEAKDALIAKFQVQVADLGKENGALRTANKRLEGAEAKAEKVGAEIASLKAEFAIARRDVIRLQAEATSLEAERSQFEQIVAGIAEKEQAEAKVASLLAGRAS